MGWGGGGGGQGGCERTIEVFVKMLKKKWGGGVVGEGSGWGGVQGGCDRRIAFLGKFTKKMGGGGVGLVGGVRVDVNEELKFL